MGNACGAGAPHTRGKLAGLVVVNHLSNNDGKHVEPLEVATAAGEIWVGMEAA